ncbi:SGNH/GDSL hydrolase family protein [Williamsia sp. M5A3_1d]
MRTRVLAAVGAAAVVVAGLVTTPAWAAPGPLPNPSPTATYYVSLGDSLAAGYQPNTKTDEPVSYTDRIYDALKASDPNLVHVRLGCSGETTATMIDGGRCTYAGASSQLDQATRFLTANRARVRFVTLDIGANDLYRCLNGSVTTGSSALGIPDVGCIGGALQTVGTNLSTIDGRLRAAGGPGPRYVGMNYYTPPLRQWIDSAQGKVFAQATAAADNIFSNTIRLANAANGFATADVLNAFSNNDAVSQVAVDGFGPLPKNVARICQWTWGCTQYKDIHANPTGHRVIADTFLPLLR